MFQPHNLKRGYSDADVRAEWMLHGSRSFIEVMDGNVMDYLSNVMRTVVTAPAGCTLAVEDFGSIESRVLGWVANCQRINTLFASGLDSYKDFATEVYGVAYDDVSKAQRTFCKPPVLGCGYQLGGDGLVTYAEGMGVDIDTEEAKRLVALWRRLYPEVVEMWYWLVGTCKQVTLTGESVCGYMVNIRRDRNFLFIDLPSGRSIAYFHPLVEDRTPPWGGDKVPTMTYMGMDQYTHKWKRISTHGGKITENIVQAIARDLLRDALRQMDAVGMDICGHVHDEVLVVTGEDVAEDTLKQMNTIMSTTPSWARGLLLGAEGYITKRYRKD
jgi:DNA polymerase